MTEKEPPLSPEEIEEQKKMIKDLQDASKDNLFDYLKQINSGSHSNIIEKMNGGWIIDHGVCFPFQDKFRDNKPEAQYRASNLNISRFTTHFPNSLRLIPTLSASCCACSDGVNPTDRTTKSNDSSSSSPSSFSYRINKFFDEVSCCISDIRQRINWISCSDLARL